MGNPPEKRRTLFSLTREDVYNLWTTEVIYVII